MKEKIKCSIIKKKILDERNHFSKLSLSLDSNIQNKGDDINNIYTYMKYNKFEKTRQLFNNYLKKYNKKYEVNDNIKENGIKLYPIIYNIKQNSIKYNLVNIMKNLNNNKYIDLILYKNKNKKHMKRSKKLDENMKDIGYESVELMLDINQDLIIK